MTVELTFLAGDHDLVHEIGEISPEIMMSESTGFDGSDKVVLTLTSLSAPVVAALTKILLECVRNRRFVKVRYKDFTVEGVSEARVLKIIEAIRTDVHAEQRESDC